MLKPVKIHMRIKVYWNLKVSIHLNPHTNLDRFGQVLLILDPSTKQHRLLTVINGYLHPLPTQSYIDGYLRLLTVIYSYLQCKPGHNGLDSYEDY